MPLTECRNIFFDLDRTLWDFDFNSAATLRDIHGRFELSRKAISQDSFLTVFVQVNHALWQRYQKREISRDELRALRFKMILEHFGCDDHQLGETLSQTYVYEGPRKTKLVDGTLEVLDHLKEKKYPLYIISNGFQPVQEIKLKSSGIYDYFSGIYCSSELAFSKPNPKIFKYVLEENGLNEDETCMVGDHQDHDIRGAKQAGLKTVWYNPGNKQAGKHAHLIIRDLLKLKEYL